MKITKIEHEKRERRGKSSPATDDHGAVSAGAEGVVWRRNESQDGRFRRDEPRNHSKFLIQNLEIVTYRLYNSYTL